MYCRTIGGAVVTTVAFESCNVVANICLMITV